MENTITKRISRDGIKIKVVIREQRYDVYIDITPEADISKKIKCEEFTLKFFLTNGEEKLKKTVHLERKNKKYNASSGLSNVRFKFKTEEYKCEISLAPKVYVPENIIEEAEKNRILRKRTLAKRNKVRINHNYRPGMAISRTTKYSKSNVRRPYSGGRCSPK